MAVYLGTLVQWDSSCHEYGIRATVYLFIYFNSKNHGLGVLRKHLLESHISNTLNKIFILFGIRFAVHTLTCPSCSTIIDH